jgi:sortase A
MLGIEEGTENEILNKSIGHFEESEIEFGNVCLAAHNRGYDVNYFEKVKTLEKGDIIYYFVNENIHKYEVSEILVIYETDWSMLENTEDNRITLITCIENRDEYRLCVQAKEVINTDVD